MLDDLSEDEIRAFLSRDCIDSQKTWEEMESIISFSEF